MDTAGWRLCWQVVVLYLLLPHHKPIHLLQHNQVIVSAQFRLQLPGLKAISDPELLQSALGQPDKGQLCMGQVFVATAAVKVYRVWDQSKSYTLYGRWWSFMRPEGPTEQYREANAICPNWSVLNQMSSCTLKVGSKIVVGPGQSADCGDGLVYPKSAVNQVYINNDSRNNVLWVENCDAGSNWPQ